MSSGRLFLLVRQMAPIRCGRYYIIVATCFFRYFIILIIDFYNDNVYVVRRLVELSR